jgi:two-component system CheB/CheR fusion protein
VVSGDASRLQQVCVNLLTNAAKYTPRGGSVKLEVRPDGPDALVRVCDDGVGIAPAMLDAIFDLFVQSPRTLERAQGGIGVGLTLARSLVEMHGGSLTAHSDGEGCGSAFEIRLPISTTAIGPEVTAPIAKVAKGARIVVVEDNADAREMLCHLLSRSGFECRSAGDGLEAVALIDAFLPDVAIIAAGLPGIDGFELARRLRAGTRHASLTLIAVTGYGQKADRRSSLAAGFNAHLVKPVKYDQLSQLLLELQPS